jgi:hypothetical protein
MDLYNRGDSLCIANPSGRFCEKGAVKISGTAYHGGNVNSTCRAVANGLSGIWEKCKSTDQSGQTTYPGGKCSPIKLLISEINIRSRLQRGIWECRAYCSCSELLGGSALGLQKCYRRVAGLDNSTFLSTLSSYCIM